MTSLLPGADTGRPEPVLDAAKLAAAVSGVVLSIGALLVLVGWATADQVQSWAVIAGGIVTSIGALIAVVLPIITAYGARAQVTPLAAPVSVEGAPLTAAPAAPAASTYETTPISAVGPWTPPTPAAAAAEPTPIGAEAEATATGRSTRITTPTA